MTRTGRAVWGIVTSYASTLVTAVAGFLLVPIVLRFVTREDYGLWAAVGQAIGYLALLDLGIGSAVIRRTAQLRERPDVEEAASRTISTAVAIYSGLALAFLAVGLSLSPVIPHLLHLSPAQARAGRVLFLLMTAYGALSFPLRISLKALYGLQQMARANAITLVENLLSPAVAVTLLVFGIGLVALPLGSIAAGLCAAIAGLVVLRRVLPRLRISWRMASRAEAADLFTWSWLLWLNSLAVVVIYQTDNLVVAAGRGLVAATVYTLTSRLPLYALPVIAALGDSCLPAAVELFGQGRVDALRRAYLRLMRVTVAAALAVGVVSVSFNDAFMRLWVGSRNFGGGLLTLTFALILFYRTMMQSASIVVIGSGRIRGVVFMSVAEAVLNLALSLWWVGRYGLLGVAAGTAVAGALTSGWYVTWVVSRELGVDLREYVFTGIIRPALGLVPAVATALALRDTGAAATWLGLAVSAAAVGAVYAIAFFFTGLDRDEREALYARAGALIRIRLTADLVRLARTRP
jgi:O-antigen/teichoic acid export membrane protein